MKKKLSLDALGVTSFVTRMDKNQHLGAGFHDSHRSFPCSCTDSKAGEAVCTYVQS